MIYGYAIIDRHEESHGLPYYCHDQWDEVLRIAKVRLFALEKERDNAMKIEKSKRSYYGKDDVLPFETSSNQGKLSIFPAEEIKKEPQI